MSLLVLWHKIPEETIRKDTIEIIEKVTNFFKVNPKRRICNAQVWYNQVAKIRKNHIQEDINQAAEKAINKP